MSVVDEPDDVAAIITLAQHETFRRLCDVFGHRVDGLLPPTSLAESRPILEGIVRGACGGYPLDVVERALSVGLAQAQAASLQPMGGRKGSSLPNYLTQVLRTQVAKTELADASAVAAARTEEAVQTALASKRLSAVANGGGSHRGGRGMTWDEAFTEFEAGCA